ncbi:MAG: peptidase S66 [Myxococcales bacterium]
MRVVAPSGPVPAEPLQSGLAVLRDVLGLDVSLSRGVSGPADGGAPEPAGPDRYLAAPDAWRAWSLVDAIDDPSVDAIWCARGGYGAGRLLPRVADALGRLGKPLVGFSDVTALHCAAACSGVVTFHGPVVTQLGRLDAESIDGARRLLSGEVGAGGLLLRVGPPLRGGIAAGRLAGGNLALLASLCGTPWAPDLTGAVVFLEDVGEPAYRVDRMVWQLRQAAGLDRAAALIVGDFNGVTDEEPAWTRAIWEELARELPCPVVLGAPVGHGARNHALPVGARVRLDAEGGTLTLLEQAVES